MLRWSDWRPIVRPSIIDRRCYNVGRIHPSDQSRAGWREMSQSAPENGYNGVEQSTTNESAPMLPLRIKTNHKRQKGLHRPSRQLSFPFSSTTSTSNEPLLLQVHTRRVLLLSLYPTPCAFRLDIYHESCDSPHAVPVSRVGGLIAS